MSDWNEQAAPNNNLSSATIQTSKLVGKKGLKEGEYAQEVTEQFRNKANHNVSEHLLKHQPGMG